jgi:hypothetical protein
MDYKVDDIEGYIFRSKRQINTMLQQQNYLAAFNILVILLSKLDNINKNKIICYYSNYIHSINEERYSENSRSLTPVSRY